MGTSLFHFAQNGGIAAWQNKQSSKSVGGFWFR